MKKQILTALALFMIASSASASSEKLSEAWQYLTNPLKNSEQQGGSVWNNISGSTKITAAATFISGAVRLTIPFKITKLKRTLKDLEKTGTDEKGIADLKKTITLYSRARTGLTWITSGLMFMTGFKAGNELSRSHTGKVSSGSIYNAKANPFIAAPSLLPGILIALFLTTNRAQKSITNPTAQKALHYLKNALIAGIIVAAGIQGYTTAVVSNGMEKVVKGTKIPAVYTPVIGNLYGAI